MTHNNTAHQPVTAAQVIRTLQAAALQAPESRAEWEYTDLHHRALAMEYLDSETADSVPQEHWEEEQFSENGLRQACQPGWPKGEADTIRARLMATSQARQAATDAAAAELRQHEPDQFLKFRTGERSTMRILNTPERIRAMIDTVRKSPALFGGGPVEKPARVRKSTPWKAHKVNMVWTLLQDNDHAAALDLASEMEPMFFDFGHEKGAHMLWAPQPVDGLPEFMISTRRSDGLYAVCHRESLLALAAGRSRSAAEAEAVQRWNTTAEDVRERAISATKPHDQDAARRAWMLAHQLATEATIEDIDTTDTTDTIDTTEATDTADTADMVRTTSGPTDATLATVSRQVAEVIASASAAAAIDQAAAQTATTEATDQEHGAELVTVDAEADTETTTTSAAHQDTTRAEATSAQQPAPTPQRTSTTSATSATSATSRRQYVEGKSGNWRASMFKDAQGRPAFEFDGPDGSVEVWTFETGRERMAALQAMAREADRQAEASDTETDLDDTENTHADHASASKTAGNTHTAQSGIHATAPACAEDVHSTPGAYPGTHPAAEQEQHQQNPAVPSHSDKVPQDLGTRSDAAEFERATPQPFNVAALMAGGMTADDFVGLGIVYSGDRANRSGTGAITAIEPGPMRGWKITVTLEDGRQLPCDPYSFDDHPGSRCKTNFKRHGAPYLAQLEATRLLATANRKAAEQAAADAAARQRRELPAQWPQLKTYDQAGKLYGCTLAAANIRILLKQNFPGVKFSVKSSSYSGGNSISIKWTDGPNAADVDAIANQFSAGSFNGMEDIYEYSRSVFGELFGSSKYIFSERSISNNFLSAAIAEQFPDATNRPSVEDYRRGKGAFCPYTHEYNARRIRERLNTMTPPAQQ